MNRGLTRLLVVLICFGGLPWAASATPPSGHQQGQDPLDPAAPLEPMEVAITVDDLPAFDEPLPGLGPMDVVARMIGILRESRLSGVYGFSNGAPIERDPRLLEVLHSWITAGHHLGNHTFSHMDLTGSSAEAYIADIERMDRLIGSISSDPQGLRLFRYSLFREGETLLKRNQVRAYLARSGYRIVPGTVGYADWAWAKAYRRCYAGHDAPSLRWMHGHVVAAARRNLRRSQKLAKLVVGRDIKHILVVHLSAFNAIALKAVLDAMKSDGVTFIDLKSALSDPVYAVNPNLPLAEGAAFLEQLAMMKHLEDPYEETRYTVEKLEGLCRAGGAGGPDPAAAAIRAH